MARPDTSLSTLTGKLELALAGRSDVWLAMLIGSRARGTARPDSDVDVAVEAPGVDLLALASDLSLAIGHEVDTIDLREAGYPMLEIVVREGIPVHQGRPNALGSWRSQAISRLELDRPWFERMRDGYLRRVAAGHG